MSLFPYDAVYVFHDSENCYVPRLKELRSSNGRLLRHADDKVKFSGPLDVQGVVIVKEVLRNAFACKIGKAAAEETDVLTETKLNYYFVCNRKENAFTPSVSTLTDFSSVAGFHNLTANGLKDCVDTTIKQYMNVTMDELRTLPVEDRNRVLFVLISGDRDFSSEINAVRRLKMDIAVIHSADNPVRASIKELLRPGFAPCCWLDIVAAGRNAAGNPYYHALAQNPHLPADAVADGLASSGPTRAARVEPHASRGPVPSALPNLDKDCVTKPSATEGVEGDVHCRSFHVANQKAAWYVKMFALRPFRIAVRNIHPTFLVREPPNVFSRTETGEYPCCDLLHSCGSAGVAPPTDLQINEAAVLLGTELAKIVVDEPISLPGLTALELKDNAQLKSFAMRESVFFHLPDLKKSADGGVPRAPAAILTPSAPVVSSALDLLEAAEALHAYILTTSAATKSREMKIAKVGMAGFYAVCTPSQKALIKTAKKRNVFCEANHFILREDNKGWIYAKPKPPAEVWKLFKFVVQHGTARGETDGRKVIPASKIGDFYGPNGTHPELKEVITANGTKKLKEFLQSHPLYFDYRPSGEADGFGLVYAQYTADVASLAPALAARLPAAAVPSTLSASTMSISTRVVLVHSEDNVLGRDRVLLMLHSLCPPTTDTITISDAAMVGLCRNALPTLQSVALRHGVLSLAVKRAPQSCSVELTGPQKCVAEAKAAIQALLDSVQIKYITLPVQYANKRGLLEGLKTTARELLSTDSGNADDDDTTSNNSGDSGSTGAVSQCMYAHIVYGRPIQAAVLYLPPIATPAEDAAAMMDSFAKVCDSLQLLANTYDEFFCTKRAILPTADTKNLQRRFALFDVSISTPGILLCGPQAEVQDAADALTKVPEQDRFERRVYKTSDRSVSFLLKNRVHSAVLASLKQAVTAAGAQAVPYTGPQSFGNSALFTVQGTVATVKAAFVAANALEAKWFASLVDKPLCEGRITPAQIKYVTEDKRVLTTLCAQHGVALKHTCAASEPTKAAPPAAQKLRRLLKAHMGEVELVVLQGNLLAVGCDAVVNPTNEDLNHGGGLAAAIADAAGRAAIDQEGRALKALLPNNKVAMGTSVCTGAYNLTTLNKHAKLVIHAVGPRYVSGSTTERANYRRCVMSALDAATKTDRAQIEYLTFTLMGTNIFGWPLALAAELLVSSIAEWLANAFAAGPVQLKRIVLADINSEPAVAMVEAVKTFNDRIPALLADIQSVSAPAAAPSADIPPRPLHQWYWECQQGDGPVFKTAVIKEGGRRWVPYDYDQVMEIESAMEYNTLPVTLRGDISKITNGALYQIAQEPFSTFDGKETVQFFQMRLSPGVQTNFKRAVRREAFTKNMTMVGFNDQPVAIPVPLPAAIPAPVQAANGYQEVSRIEVSRTDSTTAASGGFSLLGVAAHIANMEAALLEALEQAKRTSATAADLSITEPEDWDSVLTKLRAHLVDSDVEAEVLSANTFGAAPVSDRSVLVRAIGATELVRGELAVANFVNKIIKSLAEEAIVQWPSTWTNGPFNVQDGRVQLIEIERDSPEWADAEEKWRVQSGPVTSTPPSVLGPEYVILSVKRVQNPVAWAAYQSRVRLTAAQLPATDPTASVYQRANEWIMKHGTLQTDPEVVASSAEGIDSRYAGDNLFFGRAAYTAEDAAYSHSYAYRMPNTSNVRQMLLVRVAAGRINEQTVDGRLSGPHRSLKMPPAGYHSVRGNVGGSGPGSGGPRYMALMVYQTDTAYPSYLITYRKD